tara:strand:+ start:4263 stop:7115 length:2853 start_codon:yes stop_codon:yes gene_type:complete
MADPTNNSLLDTTLEKKVSTVGIAMKVAGGIMKLEKDSSNVSAHAAGIIKSSTSAVATGDVIGNKIVSVNGPITVPADGKFQFGGTDINANDLDKISGAGVNLGTVQAAKTVTLDASKNVSGFRNMTVQATMKFNKIKTGSNTHINIPANANNDGGIARAKNVSARNSFKMGTGANEITITDNEIKLVNSVTTNGTVILNSGVTANSSRNVEGFRNMTIDEDLSVASNVTPETNKNIEGDNSDIGCHLLKPSTKLQINNTEIIKDEIELLDGITSVGSAQEHKVLTTDTDLDIKDLVDVDISSELNIGAITANNLYLDGVQITTGGDPTFNTVGEMITSLSSATVPFGSKANVADTSGNYSSWLKIGEASNPSYYLIESNNLTRVTQTLTAKYEVTNSVGTPAQYTKNLVTTGSTNSINITTTNKYVHFELTVTDELPPSIIAPYGAVTNITTGSASDSPPSLTLVTSGNTHTWKNHIYFNGTNAEIEALATSSAAYVIRSIDRGGINVYKTINLELKSVIPVTYETDKVYWLYHWGGLPDFSERRYACIETSPIIDHHMFAHGGAKLGHDYTSYTNVTQTADGTFYNSKAWLWMAKKQHGSSKERALFRYKPAGTYGHAATPIDVYATAQMFQINTAGDEYLDRTTSANPDSWFNFGTPEITPTGKTHLSFDTQPPGIDSIKTTYSQYNFTNAVNIRIGNVENRCHLAGNSYSNGQNTTGYAGNITDKDQDVSDANKNHANFIWTFVRPHMGTLKTGANPINTQKRYRIKHVGTGFWTQCVYGPNGAWNIWSNATATNSGNSYTINTSSDPTILSGYAIGAMYEFKSTDHGVGAVFKVGGGPSFIGYNYDGTQRFYAGHGGGDAYFGSTVGGGFEFTITERGSANSGKYTIQDKWGTGNPLLTVFNDGNTIWQAYRARDYSQVTSNYTNADNQWEFWELPDADYTDIDK